MFPSVPVSLSFSLRPCGAYVAISGNYLSSSRDYLGATLAIAGTDILEFIPQISRYLRF